MRGSFITGICLLVASVPLSGQGIGVAAHAGTLGLGVDVAVSAGSRIGFRVGGNVFPSNIDLTADDLEYSVDLPSPQFTALIDLYLVGGFRVSGGLFASSDDVNLEGTLTQNVEIGNSTYTPAEIGTLTGTVVNNDTGPYLGIGFGNPASSRIGFFLDLGIAFQGKPVVTLGADGPVQFLPGFQADLEAERLAAEEDLEPFQYYPVLSVGFSIKLAG